MSNRITIAALVFLTVLVTGAIVYAERVRPREITLPVKGMVCDSCEQVLRNRLLSTPGVTGATASHEDQQVTVVVEGWTRPDESQLHDVIKRAGYEPEQAD
jgi:copper chaperone CopZ